MTSANDTTITPRDGAITDASGNTYTITTAGIVDRNGTPLGYTANVVQGAYANGHFWQQNSSNLWWEYTGNPAAPWTGLGTSAGPVPTLINFGPGTASETLTGAAYSIHVAATEYSGATEPANVTLVMANPNPTVDFVVVGGIGDASGEGEYVFPAALNVTFNHLTYTADDHSTFVNRQFSAANVTFTGRQLDNAGDFELNASHVQINAAVVGTGSWGTWLSDLTFIGPVSAGQTIGTGIGSNVTIDDPRQFSGLIDSSNEYSSVTLADLTATSYSYVNNFLTLYAGNHAIDHLRFADSGAFGVYQSASGVIISDTAQGTALPVHTGV